MEEVVILSLPPSLSRSLALLFLGNSRATTSTRDRGGWVGGWRRRWWWWWWRASINQAEPEGFRGGRDGGKRAVKDGGEGEMMALVVLLGARE